MRSAICFVLAILPLSASPLYTIMDLSAGYTPLSIDLGGNSAGRFVDATGRQQAFSTITGMLIGPGGESAASQMNNFSQISGTVYVQGQARAAVWTNGQVQLLDSFQATESFAMAINDYGQVAGGAVKQGRTTAFISTQGSVQWLGTLAGGDWSSAYALNTAGEVAGTSSTGGSKMHAFVWDEKTGMTDLGTLGGSSSYAAAMNSGGTVAGNSFTSNGYTHAFAATRGGSMTDLGTLGGNSSVALSINSKGEIVGYSETLGGSGSSAFVYRNGGMTNLNSLIPTGSGWKLLSATAISDSGQIVGLGLFQGQERGFRLDPVWKPTGGGSTTFGVTTVAASSADTPEPASWALTLAALGVLTILRKR